MDITLLFKACVKTVKTRNKSLAPDKSSILKTVPRDVNLVSARDIIRQITNLQSFLQEHKAAYLNVLNYLSTNKTMSEVDREGIDAAAEKLLNTCSSLLKEYRREIGRLKKSPQKTEHYGCVIESLEWYLKSVGKSYAETKAVRVKRVLETHKVAKLEGLEQKKDRQVLTPITTPLVVDDELSVEEMQMFESENEMLYNNLNATSEEIKQMESKVVHISELQELFTEKVLEQEQDINRISNNIVGATNNMKDANEQIRQTIQRNAGLRVWVLFFLLVMSFSLLFLDWYND